LNASENLSRDEAGGTPEPGASGLPAAGGEAPEAMAAGTTGAETAATDRGAAAVEMPGSAGAEGMKTEEAGSTEAPVAAEAAAESPGSEPAAEAVEAEEAEPAWTPEPSKLLCSLLFASNEYLPGRALREIMGDDWDLASLRRLAKQANKDLEEQGQPFEIVEVDGTFRMRTRTQYYPWVRRLFKESNPRRLSQASLETLAIIAYKQPITKAEIEAIRGVNVDGCMKSLLEKKLVDVNGRTDAMGGAFTYSTTREFMRYFGVSRVPDDLPRLTEFEAIVNAQALIPQIGPDGSVIEVAQQEPDGEQLSLDQLE
jgi:segregation and condensation protein B